MLGFRFSSPLARVFLISTIFGVFSGQSQAGELQEIHVGLLTTAPMLDGNGDDWLDVPEALVPLRSLSENSVVGTRQIAIKGGRFGDQVYFYLEWDDPDEDLKHKPWVWDSSQNKYERGSAREDRLALQFAISGDYSADWLSGNAFTADMWHWKSSRSNPIGLAHDKVTIVSPDKIPLAYHATSAAGEDLYFKRSSDAGEALYKTTRYRNRVEDEMPKYVFSSEASGSISDIQASGVWRDGKWHLELSRKMDTGHQDDASFSAGSSVLGAIAVFDGSENDDHVVSSTLRFDFD